MKKEIEYIIDRAWYHVDKEPHKQSLRWVFYRLLQEGTLKGKGDYDKLKRYLSTARKTFFKEWTPNTLSDATRNILYYGWGSMDKREVTVRDAVNLDKAIGQDYYVIICFEASAMTPQFQALTQHIPLVPFRGDVSIPIKWEIAKHIEMANKKYNVPIKLLYFGDCDVKGTQIKSSAMYDIVDWCNVDFDIVYGGLTIPQAERFKLPFNPDKPTEYQWEALTNEQAKTIIRPLVIKYQNQEQLQNIIDEEDAIIERIEDILEGAE